ncbi:MAG: hypothetical protein P8Y08_13755 [Desulfobulbaceae bacterium]
MKVTLSIICILIISESVQGLRNITDMVLIEKALICLVMTEKVLTERVMTERGTTELVITYWA